NPPGYIKNGPNRPANKIGGDYWAFSRDVNQNGNYWLSSMAFRPQRNDPPGVENSPFDTGTAMSPIFTIQTNYIHFLIGGDSAWHERVQLEVGGGVGSAPPAYDGLTVSEPTYGGVGIPSAQTPGFKVVRASSALETGEFMKRRVIWDVRALIGRPA